MPAPTVDPNSLVTVAAPPDGYQPRERVWVHRSGSWRPGVVLCSTLKAVTVRYRQAEGRGTAVDTVTTRSLAVRNDEDPYLDWVEDR